MSYKLVEIQTTSNDVVNKCFKIVEELSSNCRVFLNEEGKIYERNFIISFAYQLGKSAHGIKYLVSGELNKIICLENDSLLRQSMETLGRKIDSNGGVTIIPDFVIHSSLDKKENTDGQKMILEAKTAKELNQDFFNWDFLKLNGAVDVGGNLNFDNAVYLIIGHEVSKIEDYLKVYTEKGLFLSKQAEKILFFIQENPDTCPRLFQLKKEHF